MTLGLTAIDHILADDRFGVTDYSLDDLPGSDRRAIHARPVPPSRESAPPSADDG